MLNIIILADEVKESIFKYHKNTALIKGGGAAYHDVPKNIFNKQSDKGRSLTFTFGRGGGEVIPIITN
jgi:hypothetical protein